MLQDLFTPLQIFCPGLQEIILKEYFRDAAQQIFTYSKLEMEATSKGMKFVQS